jgi:hypothetical protein
LFFSTFKTFDIRIFCVSAVSRQLKESSWIIFDKCHGARDHPRHSVLLRCRCISDATERVGFCRFFASDFVLS